MKFRLRNTTVKTQFQKQEWLILHPQIGKKKKKKRPKINKVERISIYCRTTINLPHLTFKALCSLLVLPYQNYFYRCCAVLRWPRLVWLFAHYHSNQGYSLFSRNWLPQLGLSAEPGPFSRKDFSIPFPPTHFVIPGRAKMNHDGGGLVQMETGTRRQKAKNCLSRKLELHPLGHCWVNYH